MKSLMQLKQQSVDTIKSQPSVRQATQWYGAQNPRDKRILKLLAGLLVLLVIYFLLISPALNANKAIKSKLASNVVLYDLIAKNAHRFGDVNTNSSSQAPLLSLISQQAQRYGIGLSRYEQSDQGVKIWLENVAFDQAIEWLENLKTQSGVLIKQINIDKQNLEGRVNLRATLNR